MKPINKVFIFLFLVVPIILSFAQQEQTEDQIYEFIAVEEKPVVITEAQPVYPQSAINQGIDGTVVIKIVIDKNIMNDFTLAVRNTGFEINKELELGTAIEYSFKHKDVPFAMKLEMIKGFIS